MTATSAAAGAFVPLFIDLLFIGEQEVPPPPVAKKQWTTKCLSGSFRGMPGITYIANGQFANGLKIADALVHEAVHGLLLMYEAITKPLLRSWGKGVRLDSPWSENPLPVLFYVHACFVCYALAHFWRQALEQRGDPGCGALMDWAVAGFRQHPVSGKHRAALETHAHPEVLAALDELEQGVLADRWPSVGPH